MISNSPLGHSWRKANASSNTASPDTISLSADIVSAYVSHNSVTSGGLPALIESVHLALTNLGAAGAIPKTEVLEPAVPIRKSITPGFLICLDDGKKFKSLKRHLASLGMTPGQYRQKWNLPKAILWWLPNMPLRGRRSLKNSALDGWSTTRERRSQEGHPRRCRRRLRRRLLASWASAWCGAVNRS